MHKRFESFLTGHKDSQLFCQSWQVEKPKGALALTHGIGEHSECYNDFAEVLCAGGWNVYAWDLRGHGRSEGQRGYVENFEDFIHDHRLFFHWAEKEAGSMPVVAFGHSMGGVITTASLLHNEDVKPKALALSSPGYGIAIPVPRWKEAVANIAADWLPKLTMWNEIRYNQLTRDPNRIKMCEKDPLRHDKISSRLFLGLLKVADEIAERAEEITIPVSLQVAGHDELVSTDRALEIYKSFPNSRNQMHVYGESYHEIFNDLDRDRAFRDLKVFLNEIETGAK